MGAELGASALTFSPGPVVAGEFAFAVGTAGSTTLVLQTILPALLTASAPSKVILEGGTHNPAAPPFDFLIKSFLPLINRMGPMVSADLHRPGFYPAGGGRLQVSIRPASQLLPLAIIERGSVLSTKARAMIANLPLSIAAREVKLVARLLSLSEESLTIEEISNAPGQGNIISIEIEMESHTEVFTGFGEVAVRAEAVATRVAQEARSYLASGVPIGKHLADQLLVPMALAGAGTFRTGALSRHTTTNIDVIRQFVDLNIELIEEAKRTWMVTINPSRALD